MQQHRRFDLVLLAGDMACFAVFALIGLRSHEDGISGASLLRVTTPFQAGWLVAAAVLSQLSGVRGQPYRPRTVLLTWLPAWALGLAIRGVLFGRGFSPVFAVITFVTNALLLLAWRCLLAPRLLDRAAPATRRLRS
jgi:hypothetical protein